MGDFYLYLMMLNAPAKWEINSNLITRKEQL